jgi:protein involved in polysaccharide export with SLBB domain
MFRRRLTWMVVLVAIAMAMLACSSGAPPPPKLPNAGQSSTQVGPGDLLSINVVGEKDLPTEYRVQSDGTIDFPYIERTHVAGLEPQGIVDLIRSKLVEKKILTDPQVSLFVKTYESKKVRLVGQVQKPGSISWNDGLTLVDAVSQVGGFTSLANSGNVILTRQLADGKSTTVLVNVDAITGGKQQDIPLQAGDTIKVEAKVF